MDFIEIFRDVNLTESFSVRYVLTNFWHDVGDKRIADFYLVKYGPLPVMAVMASYLLFATIVGPRMMKNRKPFEIRGLIIVYNLIMVLANARFFFLSIYYLNFGLDLFTKNVLYIDRWNQDPLTLWKLGEINWYYWSKFADLFDTIFFVLRKKQEHISSLHLYHHTVVPTLGWPLLRLAPMATPFGIFCICNSLIHTVMYFYYALSAMGPRMRKHLWWKKILTQLQIGQFLVYGIYSLYTSLRYQPYYPWWCYALFYSQPPIFFYMFWSFYKQAYGSRKKKEAHGNNNSFDAVDRQKVH